MVFQDRKFGKWPVGILFLGLLFALFLSLNTGWQFGIGGTRIVRDCKAQRLNRDLAEIDILAIGKVREQVCRFINVKFFMGNYLTLRLYLARNREPQIEAFGIAGVEFLKAEAAGQGHISLHLALDANKATAIEQRAFRLDRQTADSWNFQTFSHEHTFVGAGGFGPDTFPAVDLFD